jgi:hypothetical protein
MRLAPNVTFDMLDAAFWLDRAPNPDTALLTAEQIAAFNARVYEILNIPPVFSLPNTLPRADVEAQVRAYLPTQTRYDAKGHPVEPAAFEELLKQVMLPLPDPVRVQFGLAAQCANVRAFPTAEVFTSSPFEYALDRIQETTVDVGWPVAVLATSHDEELFFCLTPLYWGWIHSAYILRLDDREIPASYVTQEPFMTTTASWGGLVNLATGQAFSCRMGTRLPLTGEISDVYETRLCTPSPFTQGYARKEDFAVGYLPPTRRTIFTQAFKMLGEPYAWGGSRFGIFGRDCSRFIQDVYATTGTRLPRNGNQQGQVGHPTAVFTREMDAATRKAQLVSRVSPGAILELPGHVMLYLGHVDGEPYAIHATSSAGFSEVVVSDLSLGADFPSGSLLSRLVQAVEIAV